MKRPNKGRGTRFWEILEWLLLHLTFIFSGIFITLWIFNLFNWQMEFLTSKLSNQLMIVYFSTAFLAAGLYIVRRAKRGFPRKGSDDQSPRRTRAMRTPTVTPRAEEKSEKEESTR